MRDSEIEQRVLNEISLTNGGRVREVCVFSLHGVVNLQGAVSSRAEKLTVQAAAERAHGVVGVINQLNMRRRTVARRRARAKRQTVTATGTFPLPNHQPAISSHLAS